MATMPARPTPACDYSGRSRRQSPGGRWRWRQTREFGRGAVSFMASLAGRLPSELSDAFRRGKRSSDDSGKWGLHCWTCGADRRLVDFGRATCGPVPADVCTSERMVAHSENPRAAGRIPTFVIRRFRSGTRRKDRFSVKKVWSQTFFCLVLTAALRFRIAGCSQNCRRDFHKLSPPTSILVDIISREPLLFGQVVYFVSS